MLHRMVMLTDLQSRQDVNQVQGILTSTGEHDVGKGQNDMMLAIATPDRWPRAMVGALPAKPLFLLLDCIQLPHI